MTKPFSSTDPKAIRSEQAVKEELEKKLAELLRTNELLHKEIEERNRAEAALRESEEKYRTLVEQADDGIIIVQDAVLRFVNRRVAELLGSAVESLTGSHIADYIDERDVAKITEMHRRRVEGEKLPPRYEALLKRSDGSPIQTELNVAVITYNGKPATQVTITDITERRRVEQILHASENRLRLFIEHAPAAIAMFDTSMNYLAASRRWLLDYGLGEQDVIGRSHYEVFPEMPERWKAIHQRCLAGAVETCEEDPFPRSDGRLDWVRWEVRPWYDQTGNAGGLLMFTEVITERKQMEEELEKTVQKYRDIFENIPLGIYYTTPEGRFIAANPAEARLLGYESPEDLITTIKDIATQVYVSSQDRAEVLRLMRDRGSIENFETRFRRKDGSIIWGSLNAFPVCDDKGNILYIQGASEDITKRKAAEESLRRSEEELRKSRDEMEERVKERTAQLQKSEEISRQRLSEIEGYYETAPVGVAILDPQLRYLRVNQKLAEINGIPQSEHIGRTVGEVVSQKAADWIKRVMPRLMESGETIKDVEGTRDAAGHAGVKTTKASLFPLKDQMGQPVAIGVIVEDITEKKRLEEELRQSQKMQAIGTLAGGIAHDFNNMLAIIMGNAELALDDVEQPEPRRNLEAILGASRRSRDLVKQILTFSRSSGSEKRAVDIQSLVRETYGLLQSTLPSTIRIDLDFDVKQGLSVMGDASKIQQVILNLASNAAHAMRKKGGVLTLGLSVVDLGADSPYGDNMGSYVKLSVADTGTGIPPEIRRRIFEPFFTTKEPGQGTGMGLSVIHGIVKDLDGMIEVESKVGKGTILTVLFPQADVAVECEPVREGTIAAGKGHILVVDDEAGFIEMAVPMLERLGYRVTSTTDSVIAMRLFITSPDAFDLIIADQTMPDFTGIELALEVGHIRKDLPVILCTGYSEMVSPETVKQAGVAELLMKPIRKKEMAQAIRRVLSRGKNIR